MNRNRVQDIFYRQLKSQKSIYWPSRQIQGSDFQIEPHQVCALLFVTKFVVKYVTTFVTNCCRNRHKDVSKMITLQLSSDRHRNVTELSKLSKNRHKIVTEWSQNRHKIVIRRVVILGQSVKISIHCKQGGGDLEGKILDALLTSTEKWNFEPLIFWFSNILLFSTKLESESSKCQSTKEDYCVRSPFTRHTLSVKNDRKWLNWHRTKIYVTKIYVTEISTE